MALGALVELGALVIPGGAAILGIWRTVSFVTAEVERLLALVASVGEALVQAVKQAPHWWPTRWWPACRSCCNWCWV